MALSPIASRVGFILLYVDSSPPTIIDISLFIAPITPPLTGQSKNSTPFSLNNLCSFFTIAREFVDTSRTTLFFFTDSIIPDSPIETFSTS